MAKKQPEPAPVEAGEVATEQRDESIVPFPTQPEQGAAPAAPTEADLSGPEVSDIRARGEAVDKAQKAVNDAREEWVQRSRLAQYGQEALTIVIRDLIIAKGLDGTLQYRVDLDRGKIVPVGPIR